MNLCQYSRLVKSLATDNTHGLKAGVVKFPANHDKRGRQIR